MRKVKVSKNTFRDSLRPVDDARWVNLTMESIQGNGADWLATLNDGDGRSIKIQVTSSQVTYILPGMKGISDMMLFATPYQIIDRLAQAFGARSNAVILDTNLDRLVAGRVELTRDNGERFFLRMSAGDVLAYATLMGLPIYMTEEILGFLSER